MRPDVAELLICPHCGGGLSLAGPALRCAGGHSFDIARQGYVNLLPGGHRPGTGDTASMVRARDTFLRAGHFAGLRHATVETAARALLEVPKQTDPAQGCIIDVGAGTGYYLAGVLDRLPGRVGLALDISKFALRTAARAHERMGAVACDTWQRLPVRDHCAVLILDVFAPRNPPEFRRLLEPRGRLVVVTPTDRHLCELVPALGLLTVDTRKQERLDARLADDFAQTESIHHEELLVLDPEEIAALAGMGPSAYHIPAEELVQKAALLPDKVTLTVSVTISVYRPA